MWTDILQKCLSTNHVDPSHATFMGQTGTRLLEPTVAPELHDGKLVRLNRLWGLRQAYSLSIHLLVSLSARMFCFESNVKWETRTKHTARACALVARVTSPRVE